jgi:hypothetical protein
MALLLVNGINVGGIIAATEEPKGPRRDVGEVAPAADGSLRITRQTRKRDQNFKTVPLSHADAYAWEALFIGEGELWTFDSAAGTGAPGVYGSKGSPPVSLVGVTISTAATPKFGNGKLQLATGNSFTINGSTTNIFGGTSEWTVLVWRSTDGSTWTHYIVRSDGAKWVSGVRNDAASTTFISAGSGNAALVNSEGANRFYDDLIILPFKILDSWAPTLGTMAASYCPPPYLDLSGDLVPEQTQRRSLAQVSDSVMKTGPTSSGVMRKLEVEWRAK